MKPSILIQLDTDPQPSVFDAVVALDAGADHVLRHAGIRPEAVRDLVHGAIFTRGPADLHRTAIFVGGSDVAAGEAVVRAVNETFFGPFRVSVLFDANGCNTTASAAVLAVIDGATKSRGSIDGATIAVLGATGPVGQRVARLLLRVRNVAVRVGSRRLDRAQATAEALRQATGREAAPFATGTDTELRQGIAGADILIAAGAAGVTLLPNAAWAASGARLLIDLNAVPPPGIEGVEPTDKGKDRDGVLCWGALGVGGTKMKIHKKAIEDLFTSNDKLIDAEQCLELGRSL
jgi:hypothetical protein